MKYLKGYKLFEAFGLAEASLIYINFIVNEFSNFFDISIKSKEDEYKYTESYSKEDLKEIIKKDIWPSYPVSSLTITYSTKKMNDEDFIKRFPTLTKKHLTTGACYNIGEEGGTEIIPSIDNRADQTIHLVLDVGAIISKSFNDKANLLVDIESAIAHELNHGYESWKRYQKNKGQVSTDLTWALDANRGNIKRDIWKVWYNQIGYYLYWSEKHETNAMIQEAWPFVKRYDADKMKENCLSWKYAQRMVNFNAEVFKAEISEKILSFYPDVEPDFMLKRMKNALANQLDDLRKTSIERKEDKPSISGKEIRKMSVDDFLRHIEFIINKAGEKIQRGILKLYSRKRDLIKSYKLFSEKLITDPSRLLEPKTENFLKTIELYHCGEHIWAVKAESSHTRAMVFLRSQEYYESAFDEIIGKQFKFSRYMDIYKQHYGKQEFTYGSDWTGFNIPSNILEECMFNIPEDEINNYDKIMLSIIKTIKETEGDHNYYLLGVDELSNSLLEHEFAHAMWYTLPEYKSEMSKLNDDCDSVVKDMMYKCITEYGYADHVLPDEMQAYMSTGLGRKMEELKIPNVEFWQQKYRDVFDNYYSKSLYSQPSKIDISWNI